MTASEWWYSKLIRRSRDAELRMPKGLRDKVASNGLRQITAGALQSSGDQAVNASTVLPWVLASLGAPAALTGLLVPIRESLSMLPQALLTPLVVRVKHRKWIFVVGALVQAGAVAVMAFIAALGSGLAAGVGILVALAIFALGRCLCSIASKDVQGRTIPKGERGQLNGISTTVAGIVAITLGLAIRAFVGAELAAAHLAWLLAAGAALWVGVAVIYAGVREPASEEAPEAQSTEVAPAKPFHGLSQAVQLLREDARFRQFVGVRGLLLVSSLSPPFIVTLSIQSGASSLAGLGGFIIASGLAALIGGRLFGRLADRSSRKVMSIGAGVASAIILSAVIVATLAEAGSASAFQSDASWWVNLFYITVYFALTLMHTGVRIGRKTYVVDMAEGDTRTTYVAVSNTAMGIILLVVGGVSALLATVHVSWALLLLAAMGLVGVFAGAKLPDVSRS